MIEYMLKFRLSFSFGRALQASPLKAWNGNNVAAGQDELLRYNLSKLGLWLVVLNKVIFQNKSDAKIYIKIKILSN